MKKGKAWVLTALLWMPFWYGQLQAMEEQADVRILIDVSGSMKQNDPKNLRRPALRLLVGLLSSETRAGVWTFGQYVNMQIPLGQVDKAWKKRARKSSESIGSPGQFTNIEDALKRSTEDWSGAPGPYRRSVILLTDGMVDISRDRTKNAASKRRILERILPRLADLNATVHTIALSKNADHVLMKNLAAETGGWYEQVETAEQLQKVFLRIFEKVGKPDAVPLQDNKFKVDESITEATLLVFHKPGAQETEVVPPDGKAFRADNAPASVSWHRDQGYDMLTISDPQAGEWKIRAEVDPDNRVMIVTDLKMQTTELPNRLIQGASLPVIVNFSDHGKLIRKREFLEVVNVSGTQLDDTSISEARPMLDNGQVPDKHANDGLFTLSFGGESVGSGVGELVLNASGPTFVREKRMTYEVVPPVNLEASTRSDGRVLDVRIIPDVELIDSASLHIDAWMENSEGEQFRLPLNISPGGQGGSGEIDLMSFTGPRRIAIKANATALSGESISYFDTPMEVEGMKQPEPVVVAKPEPPPPAQPKPVSEPVPEPEPKPEPEPEPEPEAEEEGGWGTALIWFGIINLLLIIGGGGAYWWIHRRNQRNIVSLVDDADATKLSDDKGEDND
ncbi:MAG: VWA domain-containing protein [Candidatus Thiodiazotropha sp. (ex Codakia orbicularis)]|nr:VWA domain-containing protein [Candidatus Thiodiazotropha sp. (ex Codakia orbicularis)]